MVVSEVLKDHPIIVAAFCDIKTPFSIRAIPFEVAFYDTFTTEIRDIHSN